MIIRLLCIVTLFLSGVCNAFDTNKIKFVHGTNSIEVVGNVVRGERAFYTLGANVGQIMVVQISALENNAVFQIYSPGYNITDKNKYLEVDGTALPGADEGDDTRSWKGILPRDGDYLIVVGGTRGNASFELQISIK